MIKISNLNFYYYIKKKDESKKIFKTKKEKKIAIDNINLDIKEGARHAIIGFNGAGKSTLIKLIIGILTPKTGNIIVDGNEPYKERIKHVKNIGVVWGQRSTLWWELPVKESFITIKNMYKVSDNEFYRNIDVLDKKLNFKSYWNQPVRKLSLGQRAKAEIVAALIHNPKILVLDEPFLGLDFISRKAIIKALNELIDEKGITLILTSHNIEDVNDLCKTITVMKNGHIELNTNINEFRETITDSGEIIIEKKYSEELTTGNISDVEIKKDINKNTYSIRFNKKKISSDKLIEDILKVNRGISGIRVKEESLEDLLEELLTGKREGFNNDRERI